MKKSDFITSYNRQKAIHHLVNLIAILGILLGILTIIITNNISK